MFEAMSEVATLALGGKPAAEGTPTERPVQTAEEAKRAFEQVFNGF